MGLLEKLALLSPTEFENLVYDCARSSGVRNLVWRTPGADGGRDIEGEVTVTDLTGADRVEKWYIECKRRSKSIDWPTVWKKVAYSDTQETDVFLLATNATPSPNCESEIAAWNSGRRRPTIRVWRGYSFEHLLSTRNHIAVSHGLSEPDEFDHGQVLSLARLILGVVQSANSRGVFGFDTSVELETASTLTELLEQRLSELRSNGRFGSGYVLRNASSYPWLQVTGDCSEIEEIAFRSVFVALRYFSGASGIDAAADGSVCKYSLNEPKLQPSDFQTALGTVLEWASAEEVVTSGSADGGTVRFRQGDGYGQ